MTTPEARRCKLKVILYVHDPEYLRDFFEVGDIADLTGQDFIDNYLIPGAEVDETRVTNVNVIVSNDHVELVVGFETEDMAELLRQASIARDNNSRDADSWNPESMGEACYELYFASNALPAPADLGYELAEWKTKDDAPVLLEEEDLSPGL